MAVFKKFEEINAWQKVYEVTIAVYRLTSMGQFGNFLNLARGSAAEVQSHLHIALGIGYIDKADFDELYSKVTEISRMLLSLAQYLRESNDKDI